MNTFVFSRLARHRALSSGLIGLLTLCAAGCQASADPPAAPPVPITIPVPPGATWRTAFYKRGFVGEYKTEWAGGPNALLKLRVPIPFNGTAVRMYLHSARQSIGVLTRTDLTLAGTDTTGPAITFGGQTGVTIPALSPDLTSDEVAMKVAPGIWTLEESYSSDRYIYAYDKDSVSFVPAAGSTTQAGSEHGAWLGDIYRIDVLTTDTRPGILCYGDSITAGYHSTPDQPVRYPDQLSRLLNLPVINMGVNGDVIVNTGATQVEVGRVKGVGTVVFLMGINDIIVGRVTEVSEYTRSAQRLLQALHAQGLKVYWGTILPAGGNAGFDKNPANEPLRQAINAWIRTQSGADGVIDFDKALADPANPTRMSADLQTDWLHPNDAGYLKMAQTAAAVLGPQ